MKWREPVHIFCIPQQSAFRCNAYTLIELEKRKNTLGDTFQSESESKENNSLEVRLVFKKES